jgi:hypothetical protein
MLFAVQHPLAGLRDVTIHYAKGGVQGGAWLLRFTLTPLLTLC